MRQARVTRANRALAHVTAAIGTGTGWAGVGTSGRRIVRLGQGSRRALARCCRRTPAPHHVVSRASACSRRAASLSGPEGFQHRTRHPFSQGAARGRRPGHPPAQLAGTSAGSPPVPCAARMGWPYSGSAPAAQRNGDASTTARPVAAEKRPGPTPAPTPGPTPAPTLEPRAPTEPTLAPTLEPTPAPSAHPPPTRRRPDHPATHCRAFGQPRPYACTHTRGSAECHRDRPRDAPHVAAPVGDGRRPRSYAGGQDDLCQVRRLVAQHGADQGRHHDLDKLDHVISAVQSRSMAMTIAAIETPGWVNGQRGDVRATELDGRLRALRGDACPALRRTPRHGVGDLERGERPALLDDGAKRGAVHGHARGRV